MIKSQAAGMGRTPGCEGVGLRRGPWAPEEDRVLINYITQNGHGNWRALPQWAGLLRCGKSCRLRWVNYLRPNIKRGNFTVAEEETIIKLHQELGNKWSMIAGRLTGRTDNEIKNVWHGHLKKRANRKPGPPDQPEIARKSEPAGHSVSKPVDDDDDDDDKQHQETTTCPAESSSENSSSTAGTGETNESFWSDVFPADELSAAATTNFSDSKAYRPLVDFDYESINLEGGDDFWKDMFQKSDEDKVYMT